MALKPYVCVYSQLLIVMHLSYRLRRVNPTQKLEVPLSTPHHRTVEDEIPHLRPNIEQKS